MAQNGQGKMAPACASSGGSVNTTVILVLHHQAILILVWPCRRLGDSCLGRFQAEWGRACDAAGVPAGWKSGGYVFHFSRNSAVTNLSGAGIPDTVAMTITGHRTLAVYKRYGIRQESVQRAAMEKVEAYVHGLGADDRDEKRNAS